MTVDAELPLARPDPITPPPAHDRLRAQAPVARVTTAWGPAWLVTSADLATTALTDPRLGITPPSVEADVRASLFCDGPDHARLRRLVAAAFRPARIERLRPRLAELAEQHVDRLVSDGPPVDLVDALAAVLPVEVIAELVGVDPELRARFRELAEALLAVDPLAIAADPDLAEVAVRTWDELAAFVSGLATARRADPRDDLLSDLVAVRATDDGRLSDAELVALVQVLLSAGTLTIRNALVVAVVHLLVEGSYSDLTPQRSPAVVEEVVRRAAVEPFPRFAHAEIELGGVRIEAGAMVLVSLEAANHDPARFEDPRHFRPTRTGPHLGFGHGPHHCLGAALARAELTAVLPVLARRLPGLRLEVPVEQIPWHRGLVDSGPVALPVTW